MTEMIRAALERLHQYAEAFPEHDTDSIVARARAALSADGPAVSEDREPAAVVGEPSNEELLSLWGQAILGLAKGSTQAAVNLAFARAVLARYGHQPAPPAEGEVGDEARYLAKELRDQADDMSPALELFGLMHRAADLLSQCHPAPVPVSERLPGPEDCDGEGLCWVWNRTAYTWGLFRFDLTAHSHLPLRHPPAAAAGGGAAMNHFISITSNGGYIGRWCWCNAGTNGSDAGKGVCLLLPVTDRGAWAGSIPVVRALIR